MKMKFLDTSKAVEMGDMSVFNGKQEKEIIEGGKAEYEMTLFFHKSLLYKSYYFILISVVFKLLF